MTGSYCYKCAVRRGQTDNKPIGIVVHDTAAGNPKLSRYVQPLVTDENYDYFMKLLGKNPYNNDWNHESQAKGVSAFIGKLADGSVATMHVIPYGYKLMGSASGPNGHLNSDYIQFEMCDDGYKDADYFAAVYKEAVEYAAHICKMFHLDPMGFNTYKGVKVPVIVGHYEGGKLGVASNHNDPSVWFPKFGKSMDTFRQDVVKCMSGVSPSAKPASTAPTPAPSKPQSVQVDPTKDLIKKGQEAAVKFTGISKIDGDNFAIDGVRGNQTRRMAAMVLQTAINKDYGKNLVVDGYFQTKSKQALGSHYVERGEKQWMVTAAEILLYLLGKDPNGVEYPGKFGAGLEKAAGMKRITAETFLTYLK